MNYEVLNVLKELLNEERARKLFFQLSCVEKEVAVTTDASENAIIRVSIY